MTKTYYKIIRRYNDRLLSASASSWVTHTEYSVEYFINQYVSPNVEYTKLMVFDNLADAIAFKRDEYNSLEPIEIYKCNIKGKCRYAPFSYLISDIRTLTNQYRKNKKNHKKISTTSEINPPKGTVFCNQVKLLGKIL